MELLYKLLRVLIVWMLSEFLKAFARSSSDKYIWAGTMSGTYIIALYLEQHSTFQATLVTSRAKFGLLSLVYSKLLKISLSSIKTPSINQTVISIVNDLASLDSISIFFGTIFTVAPLILAVTVLLWFFFEGSCLLGIAYLMVSFPLQIYVKGLGDKYRALCRRETQERLQATKELISEMSMLKVYTWELIFKESVNQTRANELRILKRVIIFYCLARVIEVSTQFVAPFLIFIATIMNDGTLTASQVFPTLYLMIFMRTYLVNFTVQGVMFTSKAQAISKRILEFLETTEVQSRSYLEPRDEANAIEFNGFEASWHKEEELSPPHSARQPTTKPIPTWPKAPDSSRVKSLLDLSNQVTLANTNLNILKNSKNVLLGPSGAGKSSLLLALTGEIQRISGQVRFSGKVAYVEQEPTIFEGSLKDNILLDGGFDPEVYQKVIKACHIFNDYNQQYSEGDLTEVGSASMYLSRSQKARIALARAVYSDADIYLLDDIFNGMDSTLVDKVYEDVVLGLLRERTVVLATNNLRIARIAENIIVVRSGTVIGSGSYVQLIGKGIKIEDVLSQNNKAQKEAYMKKLNIDSPESSEVGLDLSKESPEKSSEKGVEPEGEDQVQEERGRVYSREDHPTIKTDYRAWGEYRRAFGSVVLTLLFLFLFVLYDGLFIAFGISLAIWASGSVAQTDIATITGVVGAVALFIYFLKNLLFIFVSVNASSRLHKKALGGIVRATIEFFCKTPVQRVMTVFSEDMSILDQALPIHINKFISSTTASVLICILAALLYPLLLAPIIVGVILVTLTGKSCYKGIKAMRKRERLLRTETSNLLSGTFSGLTMIRSYDQPGKFKRQFRDILDDSLSTNISSSTTTQFMSMAVEFTYALAIILSLFILTVFMKGSVEWLGLVLAFLFTLSGTAQSTVKAASQADVLKSSVSRLSRYEDLEPEPVLISGNDSQCRSKNWPQAGRIEFNDITTKKTENVGYVAHNLSLQTSQGEKVCIFGDSRSGNKAAVQVLLRLAEIDRRNKSTGNLLYKDRWR